MHLRSTKDAEPVPCVLGCVFSPAHAQHQIQSLQQRALQLHAEVQSLGDSKQQLQSLQVRM
jgi:hypothetical protein